MLAMSEIHYVPPDDKEINAFAQEVCRYLGEEYTDYETVRGLSDFIRVAAQITAKHMNKQNAHQVDDASASG
jgi:hypothetical protein